MLNEVQERKKIGVYCRVSTREQAILGYGIGVQESKIMGYIELYDKKPDSIIFYIDDGISAKNMNRLQMKRLIKDVEDGIIDEIIIYKLDRLSRNVIDVYEFIENLVKLNCNLISVMDNIDIYTANGRMLIGILAIIAQWERETIKERTEDGLINACEQGKFPVGYTPYGYTKKNSILSIDENTSLVIKKIFALACHGQTIKEIQEYLIEEGIKINDAYINTDGLKKILQKPIYYGLFDYKGKQYYNVAPAIVSKEIFKKANKAISKRFKTFDNTKYYFANKVRCTCGEILNRVSTQKKNKTYYYYYCESCKKRIGQTKLIEDVLPDIFSHINSTTLEKLTKKNLFKIQSLNKKMNQTYDSYIHGKISIKIYASTMTSLESKRKSLEAENMIKNTSHYTEWQNYNDIEKKNLYYCQLRELLSTWI